MKNLSYIMLLLDIFWFFAFNTLQIDGVDFLKKLSPNRPDNPENQPTICKSAECNDIGYLIKAAMNLSVDPCEDFYEFACGGFQATNTIPAGETSIDQFHVSKLLIQGRLRKLLEVNSSSTDVLAYRKARQYYKTCLNTDLIPKQSVMEVGKLVEDMGGMLLQQSSRVSSNWNLTNLAGKMFAKYANNILFSVQILQDMKNSSTNIITISQSGLGLGENTRDYYINANVTNDTILVAYTDMLESYAATLFGEGNMDRGLIVDVVLFEQKIAEIQQSLADFADNAENYNKPNISSLLKNADFIQWASFFQQLYTPLGIDIDSSENILVYGLEYFQNLTGLIAEYEATSEGKRTLHNYFIFQAIHSLTSNLYGPFQNANEKFQAVFKGKQGTSERWKTCLDNTDNIIGYALGSIYVQKYFSTADKRKALQLISDILDVYKTRLSRAPWMQPETKRKAVEKLETLTFDAAYPDYILNASYLNDRYKNLTVTDNYATNVVSAYSYLSSYELSMLREKPKVEEWEMTPQTVNAYYDPSKNKFFITTGCLTPPFFYTAPGVAAALNFGFIGSVIGHEITHGFDSNGRQYDKFGNLQDWWDNVTANMFENLTNCLVDQYSAYSVNGLYLRGDQTLDENIADNGGLQNAYEAFMTSMQSGEHQVVDNYVGLLDVNFTNVQLFFISTAQVWCSIQTPEVIKLNILQDVHSVDKFRPIGPLSNSVDFAKAFNCPVNSSMNPPKKCVVW